MNRKSSASLQTARLRLPKIFDLRADPYERADITSNSYWDWVLEKGYMTFAGTTLATEFAKTFRNFPPRQKAASFTIDDALEKMSAAAVGGKPPTQVKAA